MFQTQGSCKLSPIRIDQIDSEENPIAYRVIFGIIIFVCCMCICCRYLDRLCPSSPEYIVLRVIR